MKTSGVLKALLCLLLTAFVACGDGEPPTSRERPGTIAPGNAIPTPLSKPVLTVSGSISAHNDRRGVVLDLETLEQMPTSEATIYEPFLKEEVTFSGVMMHDLLAILGADTGAEGVHMTALDDFVTDLPMAELTSNNVMLATRQEGKPLKLRAGGPTRIIFLHTEGIASNTDNWIWSVELMKVHQ